ncbi:MAG: GGDEF domain-containing protein, partial [Elusimicrobia bacterium]|nr:GGDEF domain-containing protein [Elusimicrobiota bacterium]
LFFFLLIGFIGLNFADEKILVFLEMLYIVSLFFIFENFSQAHAEKKARIKEEKENLELNMNKLSENRSGLTKREHSLSERIENYKSLTSIIAELSSAIEKVDIITNLSNYAHKLIPQGTVNIFMNGSGDPLVAESIKNNTLILIDDTRNVVYRDYDFHYRSCVLAPLGSEGGVIQISSEKEQSFTDYDLRLLTVLTDIGTVCLKNSELFRITEELAITDGLTGLYTHSYFNERLEEYVSISNRLSVPLSLIMLDIDRFKVTNDTYGHDAGDKVILTVVESMRKNTRETDMCARYGGEEFMIILPYTKLDEARTIAQRMRAYLENIEIIFEEKILKVTASFGVSSYQKGHSTNDFIKRVDENLYRAKKEGRNRVV